MRINENQFINTEIGDAAALNVKRENKQANLNKSENLEVAPAADSLAFSKNVRHVADITQQLKDSSDVREQFVNRIKEQIDNGTYHVSGRDIAAKIVDKATDPFNNL